MHKNTNREFRMDRVDHTVSYLFTVVTWVSILAAIYLALVTTVNVVIRFLFHLNIMAGIETSQIALAVVALCSMPAVSLYNGHIKVDILVSSFSKRGQDAMTAVNLVLCSAMMLLLGYFTLLKSVKVMHQGSFTNVLHFPYWPVYTLIGVMLLISGVCCIYNLVHLFVTGKTVAPETFEHVKARLKSKRQEGGASDGI